MKNTTETLIVNLKMLLNKTSTTTGWLSERSGVSKRMIDYILAGERKPTIDVADRLANAYGITGWQLIMPSLPYDLAKSGKLDNLINDYKNCNSTTQDYVNQVMQREAIYKAQ
jgi:transcriptional regulator with XRE-family HTH domain